MVTTLFVLWVILVLVTIGLASLIWFVLAPRNRFFTFLTEGTAKIIVHAGEFERVIMAWKGKKFDSQWNVIDGDEKHLFGGLRWINVWPIFQIYLYRLRWTSAHEDDTYKSHNEVLDYVLLKDHIYLIKVTGAEDKNMVPLNVDLLITMRVVNPYKAIFAIQDWIELLTGRMKPLFRQYIGTRTFAELKETKQQAGQDLWEELVRTKLIAQFEEDYGVKIKEGGVEMKDITPPDEYQKAATKKYRAEMDAQRRAVETIGSIVEMIAYSRGLKVEDIQQLIQTDEELKKEFLAVSKDLITRQMAIDGKSYVDIRVGGADGLERGLLNLLAAWRRMPGTDRKKDLSDKSKKGEGGKKEEQQEQE